MDSNSDKSEIAFFDVETTWHGQGFAILEFGAILVCPRKLIELEHYSTLVRPTDLSAIFNLSDRPNGITKNAVFSAPTFADIADKVYDILHGRVWAGHNILRFDCPRIWEAFEEINRPAPEPKETIDSLALLTQSFGSRAGDMKMDTLATYFGHGPQTHRSLDDVRMNLQVLRNCAAVLYLESSRPDIFTENSWANFLLPDEISVASISVIPASFSRGTQKIQILHKDVPLEVFHGGLEVRFRVKNSQYPSSDGLPRLNFVVDASPSLCQILDKIDYLAQQFSKDSGSTSHWKPVVTRKPDFFNSPTLRLNLKTITDGHMAPWATEIYHKEFSFTRRLFEASELDSLLTPGKFVDAYFSLDTYDYQLKAGIRPVAEKLLIHHD